MLDKCEMLSFRLICIKRASVMESCVPDIEVNPFTCSILIKFHHHLKSEILSLLPYAIMKNNKLKKVIPYVRVY